MTLTSNIRRRCFLAIPFSPEFDDVRRVSKDAASTAGFRSVSLRDQQDNATTIRRDQFAELARADCMVADVSGAYSNVFFEIGQAFAMSKGIVLLTNEFEGRLPPEVQNLNVIHYRSTPDGMSDLRKRLTRALRELRFGARRGRSFLSSRSSIPFFVDWERLDHRDFENLCRELLLQMGYRHVEWQTGSKEFDIVAELPKKDPDGFEYTELWVVSIGSRAPIQFLLDIASKDPDYIVHRLMRDLLADERRLLRRSDVVYLTLLFVDFDRQLTDEARLLSEKLAQSERAKRYSLNLRIRVWDRDYVTRLVHQFPQLGYKYFSDEARSLAKFRKGPEELYQENVQLTERLTQTVTDLEAERNLRVRAERDAVWKEISFSAAHKIGNPIFAIETDLDPLRKRIIESRTDEAIEVTDNMRSAVEKAKGIVAQFKSLTKAQQVKPIPMPIQPALEDVCRAIRALGAKCSVKCDATAIVAADPERLQEVLDELAANAMHWTGSQEPEVSLEVQLPEREYLPPNIDSSRNYALIHFKDNGVGIAENLKERVFEAFFTTYDQGTGLGLALVRRIIEGHGGTIREIGVPGRGADFEFYLPLAECDKLTTKRTHPEN